MGILVDGRKAGVKVKGAASVGELLSLLSLSREETLVKVNGKLAPDTAKIKSTDEVKVLRVIFGG